MKAAFSCAGFLVIALAVSSAAQAVTADLLVGAAPFTVGNATYSNFVYGGITPPTSVDVVASTNASGESVITFTRTAGNWTEAAGNGNTVINYDVSFAIPI